MKRLKEKWGIQSNTQLTIIFIVFAITGSCAAKLAEPLTEFLGFPPQTTPGWLYWTVLCPLWTLGLVARLLWSFFQIDAFKPSDAQATVSPCACLLKMKPPTRTAPPEASDGDPKIVADLSKKVATAYVVSQKSARLSDSMGKKNKKKANLAASFAESMGELSDGE